ncbi:shikimate dehydrogenase [Bacillus sp. 03113]|uniref:shikimate dehydrogenase n=1 Tax=Bacillus sp. 03113 TaxID=2578211 RepID=UPI001144C58A|nr:shikimate dehydrogenase [Bacillus sp. 03113]
MKQLYGVIGDPIAHSMSPAMHNDLFEHYQIDAVYKPFHIKKGELQEGLKQLREMDISGFNVTVPHKTEIMPYLDHLDPLSEAIGAVNTVVNDGGKWIGYNTDGSGYIKGILQQIDSLLDKEVLIIGAGGAARAIYYTMASMGVKRLDLCNRTFEKANVLVQVCPYSVPTNVLTNEQAETNLFQYDLIVQTTPIGMSPNINNQPLSIASMKKNCFVSDIIYNPLETQFLKNAKEAGAITQNGISMFVFQGALAFEKWTGIFPNTLRMEENVLKQLGGK